MAAFVVGLSRFTLLGFPAWVALIPILALPIAAWIASRRLRVPRSQAARYLDRVWNLDQRLSTLTQLQRRWTYSSARESAAPLEMLAEDTWYAVRKTQRPLPFVPSIQITRSSLIALGVSLALLSFAVFAQSPADALRADMAATERAVTSQLEEIAALRAEIESIGLPQNLKTSLLAELDNLEASLRNAGTDRGALLAALGDAQSRIGNLTPERINQWGEIIRASQALQAMARNAVNWSPPPVDDLSELALGAFAAQTLGESLELVSAPLQTGIAQELDDLSRLVLAKSRTLSQAFGSGSAALFGRDMERARAAFTAMSEELLRLEKREVSAQAVEKALSQLEDGKQRLLEDQAPAKKTQVGFNRGDREPGERPGMTPSASGGELDGSPLPASENPDDPNGQPKTGQSNVPPASIGDGATGQQQSGQPPQGAGDTGDGTGGDQPIGKTDQPGTSDGQGGAAQGEGGEFDAPIAGNPGSLTGGITKVENPGGQGVAAGESGDSNGGGKDKVYVPGIVKGAQPPTGGGQSQPPIGGDTGVSPVLPGQAGESSIGEGDRGQAGKLTEIRTPYKEVLREYAQRATEALENTHIPPDAKKLVRDYFVGLDQ